MVSVAMNVTPSVTASARLARHTRRIAETSINPQATMNSTAAIEATGRYVASGRTTSRITSSISAEKTQASGVGGPAPQLAPGRGNEPDGGWRGGDAPAEVAGPWPVAPWLPRVGW